MSKYAIVTSSNIVENIIVWDGVAEFSVDEGDTLVNVDSVATLDIGYTYDAASGTFSPT